jgi:ubiquinone/menaquinone biosynthesis C-methylase UbiE
MAAHYDHYDYPNYWIGREYEHKSEEIALKSFLSKIPKIRTILDIGAGFGRLTPVYLYRAKKVILSDPSARLLKIARGEFSDKKNLQFVKTCLDTLQSKLGRNTVDLAIMIRVLHHLEDIDNAITQLSKIVRNNGYLIVEFPNKTHMKATVTEFFKGNFTFPLEIFPADKRSKKSVKNQTIPFYNYHPDIIYEKLIQHGFTIIETRSVSNIRSTFLKRIIPLYTLLGFEKYLQMPLAKVGFGPSIFVLARKRG